MFAVRELCKCYSKKRKATNLLNLCEKHSSESKRGEAQPKDTNLNESCWH